MKGHGRADWKFWLAMLLMWIVLDRVQTIWYDATGGDATHAGGYDEPGAGR